MNSEPFKALLLTNFAGEQVEDLEEVIYDGIEDARHQDRVPELIQLMNSTQADPIERYIACLTLTSWAEEAGYQAVIDAAATLDSTPWYGYTLDRRFPVDGTFAGLARAMLSSAEMVDEKGTKNARRQAIYALISIADREYFD